MLVVLSPIFVGDTKIIFRYNLITSLNLVPVISHRQAGLDFKGNRLSSLYYKQNSIWTECGNLLCRSPYSVQMRETTDQKNSE